MVQHNSDLNRHSSVSASSPSKDDKNRHVSSSIVWRKSIVIISFISAIIVILQRTPPDVSSVTSTMDGYSRTTTAKKSPIRLIAILGERNSGTRWTFE
jgi:hypothetical protein